MRVCGWGMIRAMEDSKDRFMRLVRERYLTPGITETLWDRQLREALEQFKRDYPDLVPAPRYEMIEVARLPPEQLVTRAAPDPGTAQTETKRGGRPPLPENDWAYQRIVNGEDLRVVFRDWMKERNTKERRQLADPQDSFKKMIQSRK